MNADKLRENYRKQIVPLLGKYGVKKAAFFGSFIQGNFNKESDIDILVEPPKGMSLLDFIGLKQDIEDSLNKDVDLVSYNGLSPYLKDRILKNQQIFYEIR